jgi:hypothetical protein
LSLHSTQMILLASLELMETSRIICIPYLAIFASLCKPRHVRFMICPIEIKNPFCAKTLTFFGVGYINNLDR